MSGERPNPVEDSTASSSDELEDMAPLTRQSSLGDGLPDLSSGRGPTHRARVTVEEVNKDDNVDEVNDVEDLFEGDASGPPRDSPPQTIKVEEEDQYDSSDDDLDASIMTLEQEELEERLERELYIQNDTREQMTSTADMVSQRLNTRFVPLGQMLTPGNIKDCVALEKEAFRNPEHQATPEKIEYRLTRCGELSLGLFATIPPDKAKALDINTIKTAGTMESHREDLHVLLAHIIATRTKDELVTDNSMKFPAEWKTDHKAEERTGLGHQRVGRTVAIHSLAVAELTQRCGLGKLIMREFIQRMQSLDDVDRLVLIAQDNSVNYYRKFGMKDVGASETTSVGKGWTNMVLWVKKKKQRPKYGNIKVHKAEEGEVEEQKVEEGEVEEQKVDKGKGKATDSHEA